MHLRKITGQIIVGYLKATANEIAVDEFIINSLTGGRSEYTGYFPRAGKWIGFSRQFPFLVYCFWFFVRLVWVAGGAALFFLIQFFSASRRLFFLPSQATDWQEQGCVLALSSRVGDIIFGQNNFHALPRTWVTVPWATLRVVPQSAVLVDVFALLSMGELWRSYCYAVRATYLLYWCNRTSKWVLQSYTAFHWFAVRLAIDKLSGQLVMAEHYDRWAVLVDDSVRTNRKSLLASSVGQDRELILIQHGALGELGSSAGDASRAFKLPRKLDAVSQLYVYGSEAEKVFKRDVLTEGCVRRGLKVHYFKPTIELTDVAAYSGLKLLFVGHPLCEALHKHVFENLRSRFQFKGYYKPHPMAPMSASMKQVGWEIIEDIAIFPLVDLLIAYPSTLVVEYEGVGIPAAVHPMNLGCEDAVSYVKSVCELIDSIKAKQAFH